MSYASLTISNTNLKILSVKGKQAQKWATLALKAGLVRDGLVIEPKAVSEAIDELFKTTGIRKENVAVSLAGMPFTYRFIDLPRMKPSLLEEAIFRAARKEMSVPLEELYLSWQPVPGKNAEQSYFVLGVPRNRIDAAANTLKLAGIEPYALELQPLALARAANRRDAIIVSLEPDFFSIVFIADGLPEVIHAVNPRGEGATLEDNIHRLADELNKTVAFYRSSHTNSRMNSSTPLMITGDLAAEATAGALLQTEVDYPLEPVTPPVEFPSGAPVASFSVSAGLALNYLSRKSTGHSHEGYYDVNINLFSGKYRKTRSKSLSAGQLWFGVFLAVTIVLLFPLYLSRGSVKAENARLEEQVRLASHNLNMAALISGESLKTESEIKSTADRALALKYSNQSILANRGCFTRDLAAISASLPAGVQNTSVNIERARITVQGRSAGVFNVVGYATALENTFNEVRISRLDEAPAEAADSENSPDTSNVTGNKYIFEIVMK